MSFRLIIQSLHNSRLFRPMIRFACPLRLYAKQVAQESIPKDEPIKYSTSGAGKWKARYSTSGPYYDVTPKIQAPIILFSLGAFMIHFCILREENDLDDYIRYSELNVPLVLQESTLRIEIEDGKKKKKDVSNLQMRLEEVLKKKAELKQSAAFSKF